MESQNKTIVTSFEQLRSFCEQEGFSGWDPYDGLNSELFGSLPFVSSSRLARLAWIQFFKRSPFNLRPITGVKKEYNPKALGLFLSAYCLIFQQEGHAEDKKRIEFFIKKVLEAQSSGYSGACWGYNFDWQARAFFQPKGTPTVVASTFIACALLDAYEITKDKHLLNTARSTCDFVLNDLNRTYDTDGDFAFSYSPVDQTQVFNASLLGSRLLARVYSYTHEEELLEAARKSVSFCCKHQKENGAWSYGTLPFHQWIDNFHTGYNLECLSDYATYTGDHSYDVNSSKGLEYYLGTFFNDKEGKPAYYSHKMYPIDIHNTSQLIITLAKLGVFEKNRDLIEKVLLWTITHMQDKRGYFYYQKNKFFSSKIPYMRWAQAWMFYGMSIFLNRSREVAETSNK